MAGPGVLVDRLAARAAAEPHALAFAVDGGGELDYQAWDSRSNSVARGLVERGVRRGERVVLWFHTSEWVDYAVACAAVIKLGAVAIPIATRRPAPEVDAIVGHCRAVAVVTATAGATPPLADAGAVAMVSVGRLADGQPEVRLEPVRPSDSVEIVYPSAHLRPLRPTHHPEEEILAGLAASHAPGLAGGWVLHAFAVGSDPARMALWWPLGPGRPSVVTLPTLDPERACAVTEDRRVERWLLVPAAALMVTESGALGRHDVSSLRRVDLVALRAPGSLLSRLTTAVGERVVVGLGAGVPAQPSDAPGTGPPDDVAPVAFSQEGMLWQEQFVPGSQNLPPLVRRFRGPLDVGVLEAALDEIVRRHEPLRSRFEMRAGQPMQVVAPHQRLPLPVHDLTALDAGTQQEELATALAQASRPFDLVGGPLFEPALFRFAPDDHVAVFRVHHSVYDDWSVSVFRRELSALYAAFSAGKPSPLPDLAVGFADFSRAQHRRLAGPAGTDQLSWWKAHLAGAPFCLQLPIDDPARVEGSPQHSARPVTIDLPTALHTGLRELARRRRATPFMTMLAAFDVLVHRYTGQADLLMASVVANRNRPELEAMIGCFTKKILLRQDMGGDPTFTEVLDRTRVSVLGALPNQDLAFETVLQETVGAAAADHGLVPYVGVMFQGVTPQVEEVVLPELTTSGYDTSATTTRAHFAAGTTGDATVDEAEEVADDEPWGGGLYLGTFLILSVVEAPGAASLVARGAFHRPAVERLLADFVALLADIVADPTRRVSELRILTDDQHDHLAHTGNALRGDIDVRGCAHEVFRAQVARSPDAVAVRSTLEDLAPEHHPKEATGAAELTYAELQARADELAVRLRARGVGRGSLVGICLEPSDHCVVAALAVWTAGAGFVALDPEDDADHLAFVVTDARLDVVVSRVGLGPCLTALAPRLVEVDAAEPPASPADAAVASDPADVAVVFYGSGASSVGRGVVIEHANVVNLIAGLRGTVWGPSPAGMRVGLTARPTDGGFIRHLAAMLDGHTVHVVDGRRPDRVVSLVAAAAVDVLDVDPDRFAALVDAGLQEAVLARPTGSVTPAILVGGGPGLDRRSWCTLRALEGVRALVLYGPPECSFGATLDTDLDLGDRATVGRPLAHVTSYVLDPSGAPVPFQVTGELYVGGATLARGYLGEPPDPGDGFVTRRTASGVELRFWRTGRRARWLPDGRIEMLGATTDAIDLRGFSVDRAGLQAALTRCPAVRDARVVVEPDDAGAPRLVAYVVAETGIAPTLAELRVFLWSQLPGCAWPAAVVAVPDAATLVDAATGGDWRHAPTVPAAGVAEETFLAALWAAVVGVDRVDANENYWQTFAFLDVITQAAEAGVPVGGHQVTRNRTVASLAIDLAARRR